MATTSPKSKGILEELTALYEIKAKLEEHENGQEESEVMPNNQQGPPQLTLSRKESALFKELTALYEIKAKLEEHENGQEESEVMPNNQQWAPEI